MLSIIKLPHFSLETKDSLIQLLLLRALNRNSKNETLAICAVEDEKQNKKIMEFSVD